VNSTLWAIVCRQFLLSSSVPVLVTITASTTTRIWHCRCIDCSCRLLGHAYNFADERVNERVNTDIHLLYYMYLEIKLPYRAICPSQIAGARYDEMRNDWVHNRAYSGQQQKFMRKIKHRDLPGGQLNRAKRWHHTGELSDRCGEVRTRTCGGRAANTTTTTITITNCYYSADEVGKRIRKTVGDRHSESD